MITDSRMPPQFEAVREEGEEILWSGTPNFWVFILYGVPFLVFGILWGAMDYYGFIRPMLSQAPGHVGPPKEMTAFMVPFFALHLFPFWGAVLNMIRLVLVHGNTCYAVSNRRLMIRSGFWGTDFKTVDFDKITDMEVNVNPLENLFGVGTIRAFSGTVSRKGVNMYDKFVGISDPYGVFKKIKKVSVDIKTDWNYPNALRPEENPGYHTGYKNGE